MHKVNRLAGELSPYLLQHAGNPVNWFPWGEEAFEEARRRDVPLLVSIGYSACHWCHVMERESFENDEIAAIMNAHFVCVKVDREEHPDVDHMYMDAVQAISGSGGWPLNVFIRHDGAPFYGGTYYPPVQAFNRPSWPSLLLRIHELWTGHRDELNGQGDQLVGFIKNTLNVASVRSGEQPIGLPIVHQAVEKILPLADTVWGGFGNAPKFPASMTLNFLQAYSHFFKSEPTSAIIARSLDGMAAGGIYDQIGGGFARYSTDRKWLAPHFEKMLYDNALLIITYTKAVLTTGNQSYADVVKDTLHFVERELKGPSGAYFSALDADSEGVEGKFYTWDWDEWSAIFDEQAENIGAYFGVERDGNWEHTNILIAAAPLEEWIIKYSLTPESGRQVIAKATETLLQVRNMRIRPATDDKAILSWNSLMNTALCYASLVVTDESVIERAAEHISWMRSAFFNGNSASRIWKNGQARISAKLDDLAYYANALLMYAQFAGQPECIEEAAHIVADIVRRFTTEDNYFYFTPAEQADLPVRKIDWYDGAIPSANAVMAQNLWILGMCMENTSWIQRSQAMVAGVSDQVATNGYSHSYWALLYTSMALGVKLAVCIGSASKQAASSLIRRDFPHVYTLWSKNGKGTLPVLKNKISAGNLSIFVCTQEACLAPCFDVNSAIEVLKPAI